MPLRPPMERQRRVEQLGCRRRAHDKRQAAARQRSASAVERAGDLVSGASELAGRTSDRRHDPRHPCDHRRAHRSFGVGHDDDGRRHAGSLLGENRSRRSRQLLSRARAHGSNSRCATKRSRCASAPTRRSVFAARGTAPCLPTDEPRLKALVPEGYALSLAWPALDPDDRTLETALAHLHPRDVSPAALERGFSTYRAPIQSFVLANNQGDIGLVLPGSIPLRRADNPVRGLLPGDGRDPRFDWSGMIPLARSAALVGARERRVHHGQQQCRAAGLSAFGGARFRSGASGAADQDAARCDAQSTTSRAFARIQLDTGERFAMDVSAGHAGADRTGGRARQASACLARGVGHAYACRIAASL